MPRIYPSRGANGQDEGAGDIWNGIKDSTSGFHFREIKIEIHVHLYSPFIRLLSPASQCPDHVEEKGISNTLYISPMVIAPSP